MIRSIFVVLFILIFFILSIPFFGIEYLIGKKWPKHKDMVMLKVVQGFSRFILFVAGTKLNVIGLENVPTDQPVLYILNHRSLFDILVTLINCPRPTGYIGKIELKKVPVLRSWITNLKGFLLDRNDLKQGLKVILAAIDQVKEGISMAIFPEGTRGKGEDERELLPFHEGSFKIATKTGCLIIPVTINGTSNILEDHFPFIHSTKVTVEYGKPIDPKTLDKEEKKFIGKYTREIMLEMIRKNHIN